MLTSAAVADVAGGVGDLPTVNEQSWVLTHTQNSTIGQGKVIGQISVTES